MVRKASTPTLKTLQHLLIRIGSQTSGTKNVLTTRLSHAVWRSRFPDVSSTWHRRFRILSIDMGVRNLAFCVAEVQLPKEEENPSNFVMKVMHWYKVDVTQTIAESSFTRVGMRKNNEEEEKILYTPENMSKAAYDLVNNHFLTNYPQIILIERQRWRSSSASAIQQWTVRVNTLEGMLWAVLTALRDNSKTSVTQRDYERQKYKYELFDVDPKSVGRFWVGDRITKEKEGKQSTRGKLEKKKKISILRSWLSSVVPLPSGSGTTVAGTAKPSSPYDNDLNLESPTITFEFSPQAEKTRQAICSTERKMSGKRTSIKQKETEVGLADLKYDDLTDCLMQAAAWVAWEGNRMKIYELWDQKQGRLQTTEVKGGLENLV